VSFELIRILYLYATLTIIFMNPAIELLFGIVASLSGRRRTFVLLFFMQTLHQQSLQLCFGRRPVNNPIMALKTYQSPQE